MAKSKRQTKEMQQQQEARRKASAEKKKLEDEGKKPHRPHSWALMRSFFTCKHLHAQQLQLQLQPPEMQRRLDQPPVAEASSSSNRKCKKIKCSGSLCNNTKVMHRPEPTSSPEDHRKKKAAAAAMSSLNAKNGGSSSSSSRSTKSPLRKTTGAVFSASSSTLSLSSNSSTFISGSLKARPFRRLSGCYECRMVIDPVLMMTRDPSLKATICSCPQCGEIFMKPEHLELHQAVRHAVSEMDPEDTSKNIVEIIFQSSWLKKQVPVCKIDRILKVHNTAKTLSRFEEYRDSIKAKASKLPKKHPRCIADGNELLRFHCTTFMCSLGLNGSSNLCGSIPNCSVCSIIKNGFKVPAAEGAGKGILTTATSGKAHDKATSSMASDDEKRAMLVCRVIAGRVKKSMHDGYNNSNNNNNNLLEEYDSVAGATGVYSNLDELYVYNPKAILPCFVVVYGGF